MKIVYIINTLIPTDKAHGFQISKTCEKFADFGNDVELWAPDRRNHVADDLFDYYGLKRNFNVVKIPCADVIFLGNYIGALAYYAQTFLFSLKLFFRKLEKGSLVYSRDIFSIFIFKLRGFDVVYNAHNWSRKMKWFIKIFLNKDLKIVCNSKGTRDQIVKDGFTHAIAVPNGVELEEFNDLGDKFDLRKKLELPTDKKIIMYVGHLYAWKGVGIVLEAAKLLKEREGIIFVVIGGDEEERKEYKTQIVDENISNVLLIGQKLKRDIPKYLKSADVLLLPNTTATEESIYYTSPIKMFEYMASGVPILASDLPSIREVLSVENSLLIEPSNSKALADGILKLLMDEVSVKNIVGKAKEDVKKYTWDAYAKRILDFISIE